ncbi:hypothetical protein L596_015971 [Steinernema carpocapsae]|uniref:Uncharacterized protein n=1 Tax=Steinernema carpocapsae TaxID=34508 RepID=A0A4U5NH72_STECR|nr:hypothetical protein L596_015971 [Steinernema carpocapsae]
MRIKILISAWEMPSKKAPAPSAPVEDESSGSHVYPQLHEAPQLLQPQIVTTQHVQAPQPVPPPGFVDTEAPPSYQDALASSVNPPYPGGPSTPGNVKMPQSNAIPMYPAPPYQPQMLNPTLIPTTPIVVTTTTTTVHPRGDCNFCQHV